MKLISKIVILIGLIVFVSSCQKENIPVPNSYTSSQVNSANQRLSNSNSPDTAATSVHPVVKDKETKGSYEIVGGGDDDRDGGGDGKKGKKTNN
jgi:hypothetical protein